VVGETEHSANPLVRKLMHFVPLSVGDIGALDLIMQRNEHFPAGQDIIAEGQLPRSVFVLKTGMACRYRILSDGRRQILTFLLPGDLCDLHAFLCKEMDHSIAAVTPVQLSAVEQEELIDVALRYPRVSAALWWSAMQEEAILRERIVALGRRDAAGRVAYLLCEMVWRLKAIGQSHDNQILLPLTQTELADTLGLTPVHINRVLQNLRQRKLLTLEQRKLHLLDIDKLADIAEFNGKYLHLGGAPEEIKRVFEQKERAHAKP
jgi:CRP-like cAMP-binding protein